MPPPNAKTLYDHLLRLNWLITSNTPNVDLFKPSVGNIIFTLSKVAGAITAKVILQGNTRSREDYDKGISKKSMKNLILLGRPHS